MAEAANAPDEVRALARAAFEELAGGAGWIGQVHRAISDRAFGLIGTQGAVAKLAHDSISAGVYRGAGKAVAAAGRGADHLLGARKVGDGRRISSSRGGSLALGILQGLNGGRLEREGSDLQQPMAVRLAGRPVGLEQEQIAAAFPDAGPRLAVFLHGLMETEFSWERGRSDGFETYGERLARDLGYTPVQIRYNSGRRISQNGASLAALLAALIDAWPVEVEGIALIGHSMGGLIARSACHQAALQGHTWVALVSHTVSLGTPHAGAPLEQAVHYASAALAAVPETKPVAGFLRRRSGGIRDLRHGSLVDEDWRDRPPDTLRAAAQREVPLHEGATHCFVSATVTRSPRHPVGRLVGDLLVLEPSASGRSRRLAFRDEHGHHLGGAHHFALLNHPVAYERMRVWLR